MSFDPIVLAAVKKISQGSSSPATATGFPPGMVLQGYGIENTLPLNGGLHLVADYPKLAVALAADMMVATQSYSFIPTNMPESPATKGAAFAGNFVLLTEAVSKISVSVDSASSWVDLDLPIANIVTHALGGKLDAASFVIFGGTGATSSVCFNYIPGVSLNANSISEGNWQDPVWTGSQWLALDNSETRRLAKSSDGLTWTISTPSETTFVAASNQRRLVTDGAGVVVYSNATATYVVSGDHGENWQTVNAPTDNLFIQAYSANSLSFAASTEGVANTSVYKTTDLYNWNEVKLLDAQFTSCDIRNDGTNYLICLLDLPAVFVSADLNLKNIIGYNRNGLGILAADCGTKGFLTKDGFTCRQQYDTSLYFKLPDLSAATTDIPYVIQAK